MKVFGGENRCVKTIGKNTAKWIEEKQADKAKREKPQKETRT
jgi:hypothetical protein